MTVARLLSASRDLVCLLLPLVLLDPSGMQSYLTIAAMNSLEQPTALLSLELLKWLVLGLLLVSYLFSLFGARRVAGQLFTDTNRG